MRAKQALVWCAVLCMTGPVGTAPLALADEPREKPRRERPEATAVELQVLAIRATTKNTQIDPELRQLADKLRKFKFTGYKLEGRKNPKTSIDRAAKVDLPGGYEAEITPRSVEKGRIKLEVRVLQGGKPKVTTTMTVAAGQSSLVAGLDLGGGDELILAISGR